MCTYEVSPHGPQASAARLARGGLPEPAALGELAQIGGVGGVEGEHEIWVHGALLAVEVTATRID